MKLHILKPYFIDITIIVFLFILSFGIRIWKIEEITPGMWGDEVTVGVMSEKVWNLTEFTPFVDDNYGHPTPLLYLGGIFIKLMGRTMTSVRMVSVLFGAADISLMYVFLRCFLNRKVASYTSIIMAFSYAHVTLSRLAYEMTAAIFFELLVCLFLYLFWKKKKTYWLAFAGTSLGCGMFTYLGFRTFAITATLCTIILIWKISKKNYRVMLHRFAVFFIASMLSCLPLIIFGIQHPDQLNARTVSISVFHQNLPPIEVVKEILGSTRRSLGVFVGTFDPNLRQNPAHTFMFNPLIMTLAAIGLFSMFKKHQVYFPIAIIFLVTTFVNDIFSVEFIPEFHFYGSGHPNTLRLFGLIPIVFFCLAFGARYLQELFLKISIQSESRKFHLRFWAFVILLMSIWMDTYSYFFKPPSFYNYTYNGVPALNIATELNKRNEKEVYLSSTYYLDQRVTYFTNRDIQLKRYEIPGNEFSLDQLPKDSLIIINPQENIRFAENIVKEVDDSPESPVTVLFDPWEHVESIIIDTKK